MKIYNLKKVNLFLIIFLIISFVLILKVYLKSAPNFPVVLKRNELGFNFLTQRQRVFNFYILGIIFILVNFLINKKVEIKGVNLKKILNYANIVIVVLVFLISLQIYFLNL
ncbi:MAG TPA: hypothetical protein PK119_00745 [Candidatus Paceibacterota bacterium]|nr:hypothetical protein [Candidatus Paceibacterota bacterium]